MINRDGGNPVQFDSGYHHHKTQWFHNGRVVGGESGSGLAYGSQPINSSGKKVLTSALDQH